MRFMVTMNLKKSPDEEIKALIPAQQALTKDLIAKGIQKEVFASADQTTAWRVLNCASLEQAEEVVESLPLFKFLDVDITPLNN